MSIQVTCCHKSLHPWGVEMAHDLSSWGIIKGQFISHHLLELLQSLSTFLGPCLLTQLVQEMQNI